MRPARHTRLRVYGFVRSAHLERAHTLPPATILARRWRYDLDPSLTEGLDLIRCGGLSMAITILRSRVEVMEVVEPMMRPLLARTLAAIACARLAGALRRRPVTVVSYAIDNQDEYAVRPGAWWRRVRQRLDWSLTCRLARQTDRIVYGTEDAAALYRSVLAEHLAGAESVVIPALPSPCACTPPEPEEPADPDLVLFVGAFQARKGLPELVSAWPEVVRRQPSARLTLVGKGPMEELARGLAERVPGVELIVDPPRAEIHRRLRRSAVLVLLSQRTPTWREQVGLPIVEGLAHGCAVVTTEETGLAGWLGAHGHEVLRGAAAPGEVADAVVRALRRCRPRESVLADLPEVDGRLAADAWLFGDAARATAPLAHSSR